MNPGLIIKKLCVRSGDQELLHDLSLTINPGEIVGLMGPNGSGKSTLAMTLAGHPDLVATDGSVVWGRNNLLALPPDERARRGLFVSWQHPPEVPGVGYAKYLRAIIKNGDNLETEVAWKIMSTATTGLGQPEAVLERGLNEGFSGGERKSMEMVQLELCQPAMCVLDEIDSGLDSAALKKVAAKINLLRQPDRGWLIITHYPQFWDYVKPDRMVLMADGRITAEGGRELINKLN